MTGISTLFCIVISPRLGVERYRSGQTGQTVNLLAFAFGGSNPPLSTIGDVGFFFGREATDGAEAEKFQSQYNKECGRV